MRHYVLTALQIYRKPTKACMSYNDFSKCCKKKNKKKKNAKKLRQTLKVSISVLAGRIQLKLETESALLQRSFPQQKMVNFQSGTIELRMRENGIILVTILSVVHPH